MTSDLRLGIVGLGRWGSVILRNLAALPGLSAAAVATSKPGIDLPAGCVLRAQWRDLLDLDLDGLIIASPPASHAAIAAAAIAAGLPLFIEKPLTLERREAHALADAADAADALVMVDHIHLFSPAFRRLKLLVGTLGPIRRIEGRAGSHGPYRADADVLWDWGPHDAAMVLDLMGGDPDHAVAEILERRAVDGGTGETVRLALRFGAVEATTVMGTLMDKCRWLRVECRDGSVSYDDVGPVRLSLSRAGAAPQAIECRPGRALEIALTEFATAIRSASRDRAGLHLGCRVVDLLTRCQSSLEAAP